MDDYISREALAERLGRNLAACNPGTFSERCYADAIETVKHFPAADVEPVRHGRWLERKEHIYLADGVCKEWYNFFCSECDSPDGSPACYCPSCGAKMDLEEDGNEQ